jgi:hypothetical protein
MDNITVDKIDAGPLKILEDPANKPAASESPLAEKDRGKTSESEISRPLDNQQVRELTEKLQGYLDRMNINIAFCPSYNGMTFRFHTDTNS